MTQEKRGVANNDRENAQARAVVALLRRAARFSATHMLVRNWDNVIEPGAGWVPGRMTRADAEKCRFCVLGAWWTVAARRHDDGLEARASASIWAARGTHSLAEPWTRRQIAALFRRAIAHARGEVRARGGGLM